MAISVPSSRYLHHNERLPGFKDIEAGTSGVSAGGYTLYQTAKARTDSHNISGPQHDTPSRGVADSPTASIYPMSCPGIVFARRPWSKPPLEVLGSPIIPKEEVLINRVASEVENNHVLHLVCSF
jgi:hypothetical protein